MSESISLTIPATPLACSIFGAAIDAYGKSLVAAMPPAPAPQPVAIADLPTEAEIFGNAPMGVPYTDAPEEVTVNKGASVGKPAVREMTLEDINSGVEQTINGHGQIVLDDEPIVVNLPGVVHNVDITIDEKVVLPSVVLNPIAPPIASPLVLVGPGTIVPELDSAGFPWDERIHATTKTKMKDLTWKKARGVDPALVDQVRAETKDVPFAPGSTLTPPPVMPPEVAAQLTPVAPPVATSPALDSALTFPGLMTGITGAVKSGRCTQAAIDAVVAHVCETLEIDSIVVLCQRPELLDAAYSMIKPAIS